MSVFAKVFLSFSGLFPVFAILAIMSAKGGMTLITYLLAAASLLGFLITATIAWLILGRHTGSARNTQDVTENTEDLLTYITSFLPPFMTDEVENPYVASCLAIFYIFILAAIINSKKLFANPAFLFFGIKFYTGSIVEAGSTSEAFIMSKKPDLAGATTLSLVRLGPTGCYIAT